MLVAHLSPQKVDRNKNPAQSSTIKFKIGYKIAQENSRNNAKYF